MGMIR